MTSRGRRDSARSSQACSGLRFSPLQAGFALLAFRNRVPAVALFTKRRAFATAPAQPTAPRPSTSDESRTDLFSESVFRERQAWLSEWWATNGSVASYPPPLASSAVLPVSAFISQYSNLPIGHKEPTITFELSGRIQSVRQASKKLSFFSLRQGSDAVQILASLSDAEDVAAFTALMQHLRKGDIIGVRGYPYKSKTGELTLCARQITLLAPCMHELPDYNSLTDKELRYRHRHVDMLVNKGVRDIFATRALIIRKIRDYLDTRGFVEVETPVLSKHAGGALAKPFATHLHALKQDLVLRIAPELYLKQLIVGGMERVYELGRSFRNEGIDHTHNPEFTTVEFYQAYADYLSLMDTTEELLRHIVRSATGGSLEVTVDLPTKKGGHDLRSVKIDFSQPFRRIDLNIELAKALGEPVPDVNDPASLAPLLKICEKHAPALDVGPGPHTPVKLYDALVEHFLESQCEQPTFLIHFPSALSPLARTHRSIPGVTERFELFIGRMELCNAYSELNDPVEQRKRFQQQIALGESLKYNEEWFCQVLEWGLPPTGGWGLGIDRLAMILTNRLSIKEVLLFPFMK